MTDFRRVQALADQRDDVMAGHRGRFIYYE
jgi:hypothetical protein